ncbi:MAG: UDP-glucose 4-epimerase GalE [Rhizomicrobium sp.]|jgi:UDP-arabinose 4-epimerase
MASVLITGGAGYIGSHVCKLLAAHGHLPIAFDNLSEGHRELVRWGPLIVGDTRDFASLSEAIAKCRPDAIMHFAASAYVADSMRDPLGYYDNNVVGMVTLLRAARRYDVSRVVFSSSCATYGTANENPISEDHPQAPINPYGASKLMCERMLADAEIAHGLKSVALRYFNVGGSDPEGETGEWHQPETHLIPLVLDAALGRRGHFTVLGDDYPTEDGTCVRDFIHVLDVAEAHRLALEWLLGDHESLRLNLGNGAGYSVRQVVDAAARVTKRRIPIQIEKRRAGDPPTLIGKATRARQVLGWIPRRPKIEEQIADAWGWHRTRFC